MGVFCRTRVLNFWSSNREPVWINEEHCGKTWEGWPPDGWEQCGLAAQVWRQMWGFCEEEVDERLDENPDRWWGRAESSSCLHGRIYSSYSLNGLYYISFPRLYLWNTNNFWQRCIYLHCEKEAQVLDWEQWAQDSAWRGGLCVYMVDAPKAVIVEGLCFLDVKLLMWRCW